MDKDKARGGYYTPKIVADFLSSWGIRDKNDLILEPSCGDGHFLCSIKNRLYNLGDYSDKIDRVDAIEIISDEANKASCYGIDVINSDFFEYYKNNIIGKKTYSVILGNPPFIRYQTVDRSIRNLATDLVADVGIKINKLSNIWLPFLILSCEALNPENGRLAMVIPSELFQVDYAAETRKYLSEKFDSLKIITFNKLIFEDVQQEVVLLLAEVKSENKGISVIELDCLEDLLTFEADHDVSEVKPIDHSKDKWTKYYLTNEELELMRRLDSDNRITISTELFDVNVGVVTGQNRFFLLSDSEVTNFSLSDSVRKIVGRSDQLSGIMFTVKDFNDLSSQGKKIYMFKPQSPVLTEHEQHYVKYGEELGYSDGYKCRIRKRWYEVPESWEPDAFLLRQVHLFPKMVLNQTGATNTDTLHKIRFLSGVDKENVVGAFINSYTLALSELTGRSYGGGVLTFEPGEIRKLKIPMTNAEKLDLKIIDSKIRSKDIIGALDYVDEILLMQGIGLSREEVSTLRGIWVKLRDRRVLRRSNKNNRLD